MEHSAASRCSETSISEDEDFRPSSASGEGGSSDDSDCSEGLGSSSSDSQQRAAQLAALQGQLAWQVLCSLLLISRSSSSVAQRRYALRICATWTQQTRKRPARWAKSAKHIARLVSVVLTPVLQSGESSSSSEDEEPCSPSAGLPACKASPRCLQELRPPLPLVLACPQPSQADPAACQPPQQGTQRSWPPPPEQAASCSAVGSPVWRRTRARQPLTHVSVDALEALLQLDCEGVDADDAVYQGFLAVRAG